MDVERTLTEGLRRAADHAPRFDDSLLPTPEAPGRRGPGWRWLAAAASVLVVAGMAIWATQVAPPRTATPAAPTGTPSAVAQPTTPPPSAALPPADGVRPLVGTTWVTEDPKPLAERPWIRFGPDGTLEGHDGCNRFSGPYRLDGEAFSVGQLVSTASGCSPHPNPGFHDALTSVTQQFTGVSHLALTRADGMTVLGFRPLHPTDEEATDGVRLRLVNNTGRDIEAITVVAPDLTLQHGPLAGGEASEELAPDGPLYRYAKVDITYTDGSTDLLMPTDFVGEQPVGPGRYSYVLSIVHGPDWINGRSLMIGLEESGRPAGGR